MHLLTKLVGNPKDLWTSPLRSPRSSHLGKVGKDFVPLLPPLFFFAFFIHISFFSFLLLFYHCLLPWSPAMRRVVLFQARPSPRSGRGSSGSGTKGGTMGRSGSQVSLPSPRTPASGTGPGEAGGTPLEGKRVEGCDIACQTEQVLSPSLTVHEKKASYLAWAMVVKWPSAECVCLVTTAFLFLLTAKLWLVGVYFHTKCLCTAFSWNWRDCLRGPVRLDHKESYTLRRSWSRACCTHLHCLAPGFIDNPCESAKRFLVWGTGR